jgi:histidyl-tRNA synthetase
MIRGTRIITGAAAKQYSSLIEENKRICRFYGFEEVIIPSLWEQKTFTEKAGDEILGQMYTFQDKKGRDICLIPEVTAIIQEEFRNKWNKSEKKPMRVFYVNRCYRYERPQEGRYREFTQFGVEVLGSNDIEYEKTFLLTLAQTLIAHPKLEYNINNAVKRGLSYYTEDGFEIECPILGAQKQVCGGGAYQEGIGFAIGIDRLLLAQQLSNEEKHTSKESTIQAKTLSVEANIFHNKEV